MFPRERLLTLFTEELEQRPLDLLSRLYRFIGAREDFVPDNAEGRYFVARREAGFDWRRPGSWMSPSSPLSPQGLQRGVRAVPGAQALWRALPFETRRRLWRPYWKAAARTRSLNRRRTDPDSTAQTAPRPETIARLREHFAEDASRLEAILGQTPPWARSEPSPTQPAGTA